MNQPLRWWEYAIYVMVVGGIVLALALFARNNWREAEKARERARGSYEIENCTYPQVEDRYVVECEVNPAWP